VLVAAGVYAPIHLDQWCCFCVFDLLKGKEFPGLQAVRHWVRPEADSIGIGTVDLASRCYCMVSADSEMTDVEYLECRGNCGGRDGM